MDITSTVEIILEAAQVFDRKASDLRDLARRLNKSGDLTIAGEAISVCCNMANIRVDLLSIRPVRELTRELVKASADLVLSPKYKVTRPGNGT